MRVSECFHGLYIYIYIMFKFIYGIHPRYGGSSNKDVCAVRFEYSCNGNATRCLFVSVCVCVRRYMIVFGSDPVRTINHCDMRRKVFLCDA